MYVYPLLIKAGSRLVLTKSFSSNTALIQRWHNAESLALSYGYLSHHSALNLSVAPKLHFENLTIFVDKTILVQKI